MDYLVVRLKTHVILGRVTVFIFFALPKEKETKEKGARDKAHFPLETRYPAPIGRLRTGLKCAALLLEVSPPYAT